jgi:hypothetical protein
VTVRFNFAGNVSNPGKPTMCKQEVFFSIKGFFKCMFYKKDNQLEKNKQNVKKLEHYSLAFKKNKE